MNYKETGFRALYQRFAAFTLTEMTRHYLRSFPGGGNANCMLIWGYVDPEEGLMLEVIAAGLNTDDGFRFADSNESVRSAIRASEVAEEEFFLFGEDVTEACLKRFGKKIRALEQYEVSEEVEQTRQMTFLDASRDPQKIDEVLVYLTRDGYEPEGCRVRITGRGESFLVGVLQDEPKQNFGFHLDERVAFRLQKLDDGSMICRADLTPSRKLTKEDLADGTILTESIRVFNANRTQENLIEVLEILWDSDIWIPCNAILSDADRAAMEQMVNEVEADGGAEFLVGQNLTNQDDIRLLPDILKSGDALFLPVFSNIDEMGEYGEPFSKIGLHMLDAINVARNHKDDLAGIVVNPFTESFVLQTELFDLVEKMKSRIVTE